MITVEQISNDHTKKAKTTLLIYLQMHCCGRGFFYAEIGIVLKF